jgi:hypothetical protein
MAVEKFDVRQHAKLHLRMDMDDSAQIASSAQVSTNLDESKARSPPFFVPQTPSTLNLVVNEKKD